MRHRATLVAAMEGISRPAFYIARELAQNSRSGLTVRFLSKKLGMPEEEVEYIVDVHNQIFFSDLTKIKVVAEGPTAVKRISDGLENHGDISALVNLIKAMDPHDFRALEEQLGILQPGTKKAATELVLDACYKYPDSPVEYVATRNFSTSAREVFDIVWQSPSGILPVAQLRAKYGGTEYEVEQALSELFRGYVLFELFRFDAEERLVRAAGLLSEVRQWREGAGRESAKKALLKPQKNAPDFVQTRGISLTDKLCRLVAAIAAKPARLRGDGDLFREDRRRLEDIVADEDEPSIATCLWIGQGAGWLARVDNELRAVNLDPLVKKPMLERHQDVFEWLTASANEADSKRILASFLEDSKPHAWYSVVEFIRYILRTASEAERAVLKNAGGHWHYVSSSSVNSSERGLARSLEETFLWLGAVDRAEDGEDGIFRITDLGEFLLAERNEEKVRQQFAKRHGEIFVQPNFDIVVPSQEVDPLLTVPLDKFTIRQSTGTATVYHLSKESFTGALQAGHDGDEFVAYLLEHNRGGALPGNVMQTLDDWRGGMKRVRLRTVHVLESDDPLVIADLMHRRRYHKFFQHVDPQKMVLYGNIERGELEKELEKEGFVVN
jgi:hypothetical protein